MSNNNSNNKKKFSWRVVLGVIVSLIFVFSIDAILWAVGVLSTTFGMIIATFVSLIFVFSVGIILWNAGIMHKKK